MASFNGFLVVRLSAMGSRSETREYFLQQRDDAETPVIKQGRFGDRTLAQFEAQKVTIEGTLAPGGIAYESITLQRTGAAQPSTLAGSTGTIAPGALGVEVVMLQNRLKELGFDIAADGFFGDKTVDVVKQFQAAKHLNANGVVGPETWEALKTV